MASSENEEIDICQTDAGLSEESVKEGDRNDETQVYYSVRKNTDHRNISASQSERNSQLVQSSSKTENNLTTENSFGKEFEIPNETNDVISKLTAFCTDSFNKSSTATPKKYTHLIEISETQTNVAFQGVIDIENSQKETIRVDRRNSIDFLSFFDEKQDDLLQLEKQRTQNLTENQNDSNTESLKDSDRALTDANKDIESLRLAIIKKQFHYPFEDSHNNKSVETSVPQIKVNTDVSPSTSRSLSIVQVFPTQEGMRQTLSNKRKKCVKGNDKPLFSCKDCYHSCWSRQELMRHWTRAHDISIHKCNICHKQFYEPSFLKEHILSHLKKYECCMCSTTFEDIISLNQHKYRNHATIICIPLCSKCMQNLRIWYWFGN